MNTYCSLRRRRCRYILYISCCSPLTQAISAVEAEMQELLLYFPHLGTRETTQKPVSSQRFSEVRRLSALQTITAPCTFVLSHFSLTNTISGYVLTAWVGLRVWVGSLEISNQSSVSGVQEDAERGMTVR
ncbi:hypothetical protein BS47DRAFT_571328 [Hydnum rufescens UP504]|uniref:Uncharacterized protein n=1 Tax=Hydnum rufescens UP504 TaxID=1448309 RepID=A0A9P6DZL4_9AGAM|nr:hypothetical protein BS47DRAFT_571328 [Hydnum rufescens UP504]